MHNFNPTFAVYLKGITMGEKENPWREVDWPALPSIYLETVWMQLHAWIFVHVFGGGELSKTRERGYVFVHVYRMWHALQRLSLPVDFNQLVIRGLFCSHSAVYR